MNSQRKQAGVYVVEFAMIGLLLFTLLFAVLEMGRLYYTVGTLNEVVRRGARLAAVCLISDPAVLQRAIFNEAGDNSSSRLVASLETANLSLAYLDENGAVVANPGDPGNLSSIRFVQLSIEDFPFNLLIPGFIGGITLPVFRAILPRESLGSDGEGGDTLC